VRHSFGKLLSMFFEVKVSILSDRKCSFFPILSKDAYKCKFQDYMPQYDKKREKILYKNNLKKYKLEVAGLFPSPKYVEHLKSKVSYVEEFSQLPSDLNFKKQEYDMRQIVSDNIHYDSCIQLKNICYASEEVVLPVSKFIINNITPSTSTELSTVKEIYSYLPRSSKISHYTQFALDVVSENKSTASEEDLALIKFLSVEPKYAQPVWRNYDVFQMKELLKTFKRRKTFKLPSKYRLPFTQKNIKRVYYLPPGLNITMLVGNVLKTPSHFLNLFANELRTQKLSAKDYSFIFKAYYDFIVRGSYNPLKSILKSNYKFVPKIFYDARYWINFVPNFSSGVFTYHFKFLVNMDIYQSISVDKIYI